jgi:hypothetical protein
VTAIAAPVSRTDALRAAWFASLIAGGLAVDALVAHGQTIVDVVLWLAFVAECWRGDRATRRMLIACLLIATAGECFLSLVWGLYDYRLGNVPLFVPPGHALLLSLGVIAARYVDVRVAWCVAIAAAPVVAWQAVRGDDVLGVPLFLFFAAAMLRGDDRARRLYAAMFVVSLVMEFYGTWLGNWAWRREVPGFGWAAGNPPLAAGAFYCVLDWLVLAATRSRR